MAACLEVPLEDSNMLNSEERGHMDILIEICPQVKGFFSLALAQHVRYAMRCTRCFMQMLVLSTSLMVEAVIGK